MWVFTRILLYAGQILGLHPANDRRRYRVTPSLIGRTQTWDQPCYMYVSVWRGWGNACMKSAVDDLILLGSQCHFICFYLSPYQFFLFSGELRYYMFYRVFRFSCLVPIMAWRRPGDKPLSEPMMVSSPTHICVTRPQWVKTIKYSMVSVPEGGASSSYKWSIIAFIEIHSQIILDKCLIFVLQKIPLMIKRRINRRHALLHAVSAILQIRPENKTGISGELCQYHDFWCHCHLHCQVISRHDI